MKEIKAYIRSIKPEEVVHALEEAGAPGITAVEVKCIGSTIDPEKAKYSIEYAEKLSPTTKLEIVCRDEAAERLITVIRGKAYTGQIGDGAIFISDIRDAVKIRTGEKGEGVLLMSP